MSRRNTGQSIVEYAILLGVVITALLIMQLFIKRSYQGGLKESADKIGEQFSASGTTTKQNRAMTSDQNIVEGVATTATINTFKPTALTENAQDALGSGVYSYSQRTGDFRQQVIKRYMESSEKHSLSVQVVSFGFKHGLPLNADLVFDVRFLPNPFFEEKLKRLNGTRAEVIEYVMSKGDAAGLLKEMARLLKFMVPRFDRVEPYPSERNVRCHHDLDDIAAVNFYE